MTVINSTFTYREINNGKKLDQFGYMRDPFLENINPKSTLRLNKGNPLVSLDVYAAILRNLRKPFDLSPTCPLTIPKPFSCHPSIPSLSHNKLFRG